jgi:predicted aldo/keto reductase-like oxidoreductase
MIKIGSPTLSAAGGLMQYRRFGKLDWKVSALGFGAMRLPVLGENPAAGNPDVNEPEAVRMIRHSIDQGVNYLDTAYPYHGGKSEVVVGNALKDGYRERIKLATKMPSWFIQQYDDFDKYLNEQLEKLQTDHVDFYLLHGLNKQHWPKLRDLQVGKWAENTIKDGRIGYLGFSFHDDLATFKQIIDEYDRWTFCQIQYNFMDIEYQAGTEGLKYAANKGLALVIMEPLRGGQLAKEPPESVKKIWETSSPKKSPADWALQWLWSQPEVSVVLSGMSLMQQVVDNIASAERSAIGSMDERQLALVDEVRKNYRDLSPVPCSGCAYCLPCPNGVNIPHAFQYYNDAIMYNDPRTARFRYRQAPKEAWADNCIECLECEEKCPQQISIAEWLKKAHDYLGPRKKN